MARLAAYGKLSRLKVGLAVGVLLFLLGCSEIIAIERMPTPTPTPSPTPFPTPTPNPLTLASLAMPARLVATTIGLDAPVVEMGWHIEEQFGAAVRVWDIPENEAAWHNNSAWPGLGSNVVISGHNASLGGQIFAEVEALQIGDLITLWNGRGKAFTYEVTDRVIVRTLIASQENLAFLQRAMEPTPEERLTLITCWPNWTNTHRLVVMAELSETEEKGTQ